MNPNVMLTVVCMSKRQLWGKKLVENQNVFKTLHVQYLRMIQPNDTVMRMTTRKAPDDTVQEAVREAIVEAWCALDDVKETAKHLQGDLHSLSHNLYMYNDLPLDAILQLSAVHDKIKELMGTVTSCVDQVVHVNAT